MQLNLNHQLDTNELINVGMWLLHNHVMWNMCILGTLRYQFWSCKLTILGVATSIAASSKEHIVPIEPHKRILVCLIVSRHIITTQWNKHWKWWNFKKMCLSKRIWVCITSKITFNFLLKSSIERSITSYTYTN